MASEEDKAATGIQARIRARNAKKEVESKKAEAAEPKADRKKSDVKAGDEAAGAKPESKGIISRGLAKTGNAFGKAGDFVTDGLVKLDETLAAQEEKNDEAVKRLLDNATRKTVQKVLRVAGTSVRESLKPAHAPQWLCDVAVYVHGWAWPDINETLEAQIMASLSSGGRKLTQSKLQHWAKAPELWAPGAKPWRSRPVRPFDWLRAKILHSLLPADTNKFGLARDPVSLAIIIAKTTSTYGINVIIFVWLFLLIDRSDEAQLVRYILSFKTFQFISGLISAAQLGFSLMTCLENTALDSTYSCQATAPGQGSTQPWKMFLELVRVMLLLACGVILAGGGAWGGPEEILALEEVRVAAATGKLISARKPPKGSTYVQLEPDGPPTRAQIKKALAAARLKFGVPRGRGGVLPKFLLLDFTIIIVLLLSLALKLLTLYLKGAPTWIYWSMIYYTKLTWALLSFPFLLFLAPVLGTSLHHARPTGYDQAGNLAPLLSGSLMKQKLAKEETERLAREEEEANLEEQRKRGEAAGLLQKVQRGNKTRKDARKVGARIARHALSIATPVGIFVNANTIEKWFS